MEITGGCGKHLPVWDTTGHADGQERTPLLDALQAYVRDGITRFHMPGHKGGPGIHPRLKEALGEAVFAMDVTGVEGLDDLHEPSGVLREAQELAARAFGADHTFFLVNGTSAGVQAMTLSLCNPGDKIILPRNMHKSIMAGIILSGANPVFVSPEFDRNTGMALGPDPSKVRNAANRHPGARGVLLVNPTYYGVAGSLRPIAEIAHGRGMALLVDEAHGPHFRFHPGLPEPALDCGADACAQGMHKILGGMTQASLLHLKGGRLDTARVKAVLRMLQSTSASYVLMASLDAARMQAATCGEAIISRAMALAEEVRERVNAIPGLRCFGREILGRPGAEALDPTKVTVTVRDLGLTGQQVEIILRYKYRIQVEMSDLFNILLIVGPGNTAADAERVVTALGDISARAAEFRTAAGAAVLAAAEAHAAPPPPPEPTCLPREAFTAPSHPVPLEKAAGRICAEIITCYPPGIPVICPGERVTKEIAEHLDLVRRAGLRISGPADPSLETIRVVA